MPAAAVAWRRWPTTTASWWCSTAREGTHRDVVALRVRGDEPPTVRTLGRWELPACPLTSAALTAGPGGLVAAWQTGEQLYWQPLDGRAEPHALPGEAHHRKYPALAIARDGTMLIAYAEDTSWGHGGRAVWQLLDPDGTPRSAPTVAGDLPAWSFPAAVYDEERGFEVIE